MIGFCLVGGGFIGPLHADNIAAHRSARLLWVVDLDPVVASKVATKHAAKATANLDDALADPDVAVVMICTPPRTHAPLIERAARAGKAIFCEKPVDLDLARVDACAKVLAETRVPFFVAFNRRFDPSHRALADAIRGGDIGRPEMLVLSSRDPEISPPDYVAAMPYGIFYDTMIHDFDMVRWLLPRSRSRSSRAPRACWTRGEPTSRPRHGDGDANDGETARSCTSTRASAPSTATTSGSKRSARRAC
jgi:myo-inositol 2-dehydrogenase/D-chiro-inositol 1-dehydrogenase